MQLLLVNYHYIREVKPTAGIYPVTIKEFGSQLDSIGKEYKFLSQSELSEIIKNQRFNDNKYCLITFDDGLAEQMIAYELMIKKGIPGVFYITTESIINQSCVDVHKLHYIRSRIDDISMYKALQESFNIDSYVFDCDVLKKQYRYDEELSQKVKFYINFVLGSKVRDLFIDDIFQKLVHDTKDFARQLYMTPENIIELNRNGMLGTHSATHRPLATLSDEEIRIDISKSIDYFNSIGIQKVRSISYPYGSVAAVDKRVAKISGEFGFDFGITMYRGINNDRDLLESPMLLKRVSCSDVINGKVVL